MDKEKVNAQLDQINHLVEDIRREVNSEEPEPPIETVKVHDSSQLLAALEIGGNIELVSENEFFHPTGFIVPSNTNLYGNGCQVRADNQPVLRVKPSAGNIMMQNLRCLCDYSGGVIQLGDNVATTQGTTGAVPTGIVLENIEIPFHRGKRGIEVNAASVIIRNSLIEDVWASSGQDSQAICILNTWGEIIIDNNVLSAGSENIMVGGDTMKVPGQIITDVVIKNNKIHKPLSWQTDGINRGVKNLIELKAGKGVQIINNTLDGCWKAAQDGYALVFTPRNAQSVTDVLVDGNTVVNVGAAFNIMGVDYNLLPPEPTNNIVIQNNSFKVEKAKFGGRGCLAIITNSTKQITFDNITFSGDGTALIVAESREIQGPCLIQGSTLTYLQYGVAMQGSMYGNPLPPTDVNYDNRLVIDFVKNTFTGNVNATFKKNFPDNIYP